MQPIGTVIAKENGKASVHLVRPTACDSCHACTLGTVDGAAITVLADDPLDVAVGDRVELYFAPTQGIRAALNVYIVPLLALFLGYAVLSYLALPGGALTPALGSIAICIASFSLLRLREKVWENDPDLRPRIQAVVQSAGD